MVDEFESQFSDDASFSAKAGFPPWFPFTGGNTVMWRPSHMRGVLAANEEASSPGQLRVYHFGAPMTAACSPIRGSLALSCQWEDVSGAKLAMGSDGH
ncbi:hypothetical protein [Rhizobium sp. LjRoot254]|uniref:hypothetical protein n=1 Tax=Rhizobium sp. LjRoot254 TaxID=3342297 RepID=UPI003F4F5B83